MAPLRIMTEWVKEGDDSLRLQAEGFWNDTGVSSHTVVRFMPMSEQSSKQLMHRMARCENGSVFTQGTLPWNPPKHYYILNVQKN